MCSIAAACFVVIEVCGIRVVCESHVAGSVGDSVVGVCYDIVQQLVDGCGRGFCCACLLSADFAECDKDLVVNRWPIVEDCTNNALDPLDAGDI